MSDTSIRLLQDSLNVYLFYYLLDFFLLYSIPPSLFLLLHCKTFLKMLPSYFTYFSYFVVFFSIAVIINFPTCFRQVSLFVCGFMRGHTHTITMIGNLSLSKYVKSNSEFPFKISFSYGYIPYNVNLPFWCILLMLVPYKLLIWAWHVTMQPNLHLAILMLTVLSVVDLAQPALDGRAQWRVTLTSRLSQRGRDSRGYFSIVLVFLRTF